ncbi:hypothetical protein FNO01nite_05250 [Flavobacterium noncentrifugens]|uniref:Transposase zinc-ribbon domain-containing protein n=1 Tax=Flavobacterium noncentrifugens TaxID=1128970 RepID=A0A1G8SJ32_9FLAO|nr:hypothetical protein [Flavobacterium noncentrifugens]GEP49853.1 hypothetical protein FNO01nite_05250 [Flavobacterium noncentrifugens]SDJ29239.1 hypothetical protein SAMN04487935_0580 [Flavobacterium noncentrifugens]
MINVDFHSKDAIINAFPDEVACLAHLEQLRWDGFVTSPFDAISTVYHCSNNRFRCKNTGKYFNAKTGTIFHNSKIELQKWFIAIWIVSRRTRGITSVELAEELQLTQKSAWFMLQRIKKGLNPESLKKKPKNRLKKKMEAADISKIAVAPDSDRLQMHQWLELLKK